MCSALSYNTPSMAQHSLKLPVQSPRTEYKVPHYNSISLVHAIVHNYFMTLLFSVTSNLPANLVVFSFSPFSDLALAFDPKLFLTFRLLTLKNVLFFFYLYEFFFIVSSMSLFLPCRALLMRFLLHDNYFVNS